MAANKPKFCKKCKAPLTDTDRGGVCIPCRLAGLQKRQARLRALKKVAGDAWQLWDDWGPIVTLLLPGGTAGKAVAAAGTVLQKAGKWALKWSPKVQKAAAATWPRLKKVGGVALPKLKIYLKKENEKTGQSEK